jgi:uncharacterized membrane protein
MNKPENQLPGALKDAKGVIRWRNLKYICGHRPKRRYAFKGDTVVFCNICGIDDAGALDAARAARVKRWQPRFHAMMKSLFQPKLVAPDRMGTGNG